MLILLIPSGAERAHLPAVKWWEGRPRLAGAESWRAVHGGPHCAEQQEGGHGASHNTHAWLHKATIRPRPRIGRIPDTPDCKLCWTRSRLTSCSHIYLAVLMTGTRRTHSASSGTGINSCACPHQFTKRATRKRASRSGGGSRIGPAQVAQSHPLFA